MLRSAFVLAVMIPTVARADGPAFAVGLDYTVGHGGHVEELDLGWRLEPGLFLRVGSWQATVSVPTNPKVRSDNPGRDTEEMTGVGLSGRLAYHLPVGGNGVVTLGAGFTRRWMFAHASVTRSCMQTGTCIAGTYLESPSYHAWAPQLRIGIGPEKLLPRMVMGVTFEVIVEAIGFNDVPRDGIRGLTLMAGATFTIGGGPRASRARAQIAGR